MVRNHHNGLKTVALFSGFIVVLLLIGGGLAQYTGSSAFIWLFGLIAIGTTFWSYWNSDQIAIRAMRAEEVSESQAPGMYRIVRDLSTRAGQPMPRLYISPTDSPNAFATGRDPEHAAVCCTQGILRLLDERELRGVLGHELMHVYNRDILTGSIAMAMATVIAMVAQIVTFGSWGRGRNNQGGGLGMLVAALIAPLAATMIQLAISRTREFDADEDGSRLTGDPLALASALDKIESGISARPLAQTAQLRSASHLMIANPFGQVAQVFSTHPPTEERIARLEEMAAQGR
ncbi:MAG: zinc metalloprotease HtpX [Propionibacterium sp.]|nr:zinc metalloprotease HtpX [Propionibacterium sp.]